MSVPMNLWILMSVVRLCSFTSNIPHHGVEGNFVFGTQGRYGLPILNIWYVVSHLISR
jgi:hypothetical protein